MKINWRKFRRRLTGLLLGLLALAMVAQSNPFRRLLNPIHYREEIVAAAREFDLDPRLVAAVIRVESKYRASALSPKGAAGLMQIMPDTGTWIAQQMHLDEFLLEHLQDPVVNIRLGTWYLADLHREFDGDLTLVLAAYNGGRGKVREWLASEQWAGGYHQIAQIPFKETRDFVQRVVLNYHLYCEIYPAFR